MLRQRCFPACPEQRAKYNPELRLIARMPLPGEYAARRTCCRHRRHTAATIRQPVTACRHRSRRPKVPLPSAPEATRAGKRCAMRGQDTRCLPRRPTPYRRAQRNRCSWRWKKCQRDGAQQRCRHPMPCSVGAAGSKRPPPARAWPVLPPPARAQNFRFAQAGVAPCQKKYQQEKEKRGI
jgi:hypothetical protein